MEIAKFEIQKNYLIESFRGEKSVIDRLIEFGFHPGAQVTYQGQAAFGGPYIFKTHNMIIALRKEELNHLQLVPVRESL